MKKIIFFVSILFLSLSASSVLASKSDPTGTSEKSTAVVNKERKISQEDITRLKYRVEEIRDMDKSNLTSSERRELRKELRDIKSSSCTCFKE